MCKSRYKNCSASTLYLLRAVDKMVNLSHTDLSFFNPALDLELSLHNRYHVKSCVYCPPANL